VLPLLVDPPRPGAGDEDDEAAAMSRRNCRPHRQQLGVRPSIASLIAVRLALRCESRNQRGSRGGRSSARATIRARGP
jgi:hypothetical protein